MRLEVSDACCSVEDAAVSAKRWTVLDVITGEAAPRRMRVGGSTRLVTYEHAVGVEWVSVDARVGCYDSPLPLPGDNVTNHGCHGTTKQGRGAW